MNLTFLGFPVGMLVYHEEHWICLYIDDDIIEIFDPLGFVTNSTFKALHLFLATHMQKKVLLCSPRIQAATHSNCGKFAVSFLYWRLSCEKDLLSFIELFSTDQSKNSQLINNFFTEINYKS